MQVNYWNDIFDFSEFDPSIPQPHYTVKPFYMPAVRA
jgi:hypothetical protein